MMPHEFGSSFQRVLVRACILDTGLKGLVDRFIKAGQLRWSDPASAWVWNIVASTEYPTMLQIETEMHRLVEADPARPGAAAILSLDDIREVEYVKSQVVEWARRHTFELGFREAAEAYNAGRMDEAYSQMMKRIEELNEIRLDVADRGWFFEEFEDRQWRRQMADDTPPIAIGIDRLDRAMKGGLRPGELEIPVAYSGIGKTFWCVQRGFTAARQRRKVLHFVLEGGRGKTEDRYEARWSETTYAAVRAGHIDPMHLGSMQREYARLRRNLVIRGFADRQAWRISFDDILAELRELRRTEGWVPDLIIVDYGDLVYADGDNERDRQKNAFRQLKSLSERVEFRGHHGYAVVAPSQAVRPGQNDDDRPHWLKPRDVADCYEKVRVADIIVSLNRTQLEKEMDQLRIFLGKYRSDSDGLRCIVETDYAHGALAKTGAPEPTVLAHPEVFDRAA